jgi:hypothetical protein
VRRGDAARRVPTAQAPARGLPAAPPTASASLPRFPYLPSS